ncbi:MAG: TolB family protein, partial [Caldilineaceae bacterium]
WDLWVMNADGSGRTGLTRPATTLLETLPSNVAAAWSPDGSQIVFLSNRTDTNSAGAWRLWVMDADCCNQRPLDIDLPLTYTFGAEQVVSWGG